MTVTTKTTEHIRGSAAFQALATEIRGGEKPSACFADPCFDRLSRAHQAHTRGAPNRPSALDLAVLIRNVLRFHELQTSPGTPPRLWVPSGSGWPIPSQWTDVGIEARAEDKGFSVQARPWLPDWLPNVPPRGVEAASAAENQMRMTNRVPGDPFMERFSGHDSYLTSGQRSAVRSALCTPPGATLIICLPTGDGKSYAFQLVSSIGYGANDGVPGVTLVITPTVALALDHQRAATEMGFLDHRMAYVGGMPMEDRKAMIDRIRNGTQGLCFAAPEAVCGILRAPLLDAARAGLIRAIVVDEAHLVDAWGANFRASFQVFSGLRKELVNVAPVELKPRTLLLSATLTNATVDTLRTLFPGDASSGFDIQLLSAVQVRPEIEYWVAKPTTKAERDRRVREALAHMPRPAILYVTEVMEAERWHRSLKSWGFGRIGLMTGHSSTDERNRLVEGWREQRLDLVVGTSAFGLGIDNQHVRTVIHACIPETLDRFYQEVGRGGRDGRSAASIIIPFKEEYWQQGERDDYSTARGLNQRRLLTPEVGHERWETMFNHPDKEYEGSGVFQLRVDGAPGLGPDRIDMVGVTNTEWNVRTLTLMANSGFIELLGPTSRASNNVQPKLFDADTDEEEELTDRRNDQFQRIRVVEPNHLDFSVWTNVVEPQRKRMESAYRHNLDQMFLFLEGKQCAADTLVSIYKLNLQQVTGNGPAVVGVAPACGGCPFCRAKGIPRETEPVTIPKYPWPHTTGVSYPASDLLDETCRVLIFCNPRVDARNLRRWTEALAKLARCGVRNLICLPGSPVGAVSVQRNHPGTAIFTSEKLPPWDYLPPGPVAMIVPPNQPLPERILRPRESSNAHFIFVDREAKYPEMPGVLLRNRFEGPQIDLNLFIERMNT